MTPGFTFPEKLTQGQEETKKERNTQGKVHAGEGPGGVDAGSPRPIVLPPIPCREQDGDREEKPHSVTMQRPELHVTAVPLELCSLASFLAYSDLPLGRTSVGAERQHQTFHKCPPQVFSYLNSKNYDESGGGPGRCGLICDPCPWAYIPTWSQ